MRPTSRPAGASRRQRGTWRHGNSADVERPAKPYRLRWTFVRLATCHVDHDPTNSDPANLRAWCQRCHILNDHEEHRRRTAITVLLRRAIGDLFTGPYQPA